MKIKLGQQVKDSITGYEGTAVGETLWLYGCKRIGIQGNLDKDGKVPDIVWFDADQLTVIPKAKRKANKKKEKDPAGERSASIRKTDPQRI